MPVLPALITNLLLPALATCLGAEALPPGSPSPYESFRLVEFLKSVAGPKASNCGFAIYGQDRSQIDNCVVRAFQTHQPFFATYENLDRAVEDVLQAHGLAGTPEGVVFVFTYDFAPYHVNEPSEVFTPRKCASPQVVTESGDRRALACK